MRPGGQRGADTDTECGGRSSEPRGEESGGRPRFKRFERGSAAI